MKYKFTLLHFLLFLSFFTDAQSITGIWKGYFEQNTLGLYEDRYKFEVQIEQLANNALNGVTYSYKTTVFYGKAEAKGIYTKKTNNILLDEIKLVDLKITDKSLPCLMTCYLEYNKMGNVETLTGTYSSRNLNDKRDCGSGRIYLEKSVTSDFYKEDFLVKRENELKKKEEAAKKPITRSGLSTTGKTYKKPLAQNSTIAKAGATKKPVGQNRPTAKGVTQKNEADQNKPVAKATVPKKLKPGAEENLITKPDKKSTVPPPATVMVPRKEDPVNTLPNPPAQKTLPEPDVLKNRSKDLVKSITTSAREFKVELYDNGQIDGDRISVFHNNELIVSNKTLTDKPITFTIKADENTPVHEFVMVAENLGSIPPNTSLMIITAGDKRYELFVTSTEQKNAVVRVEYKPE